MSSGVSNNLFHSTNERSSIVVALIGSSEALDDTFEDSRHSAVSASPEPGSMSSQPTGGMLQHRSNMTMHVCWHRSLSVGSDEHRTAFRVGDGYGYLIYYNNLLDSSRVVGPVGRPPYGKRDAYTFVFVVIV
jgi:hypothetical protein